MNSPDTGHDGHTEQPDTANVGHSSQGMEGARRTAVLLRARQSKGKDVTAGTAGCVGGAPVGQPRRAWEQHLPGGSGRPQRANDR
eukprot:2788294-Alexandrium_andersonii.AAC.1